MFRVSLNSIRDVAEVETVRTDRLRKPMFSMSPLNLDRSFQSSSYADNWPVGVDPMGMVVATRSSNRTTNTAAEPLQSFEKN